MNFKRVLAIDCGTKNFAYCAVDNTDFRNPTVWRKECLWASKSRKPSKEEVVKITVAWVRRNQQLINECDVVVLENQLRTPFIVMNAVLHALCYDKVVVMHPQTVGAFWSLPRTRVEKKLAGVETVRANGLTLEGAKVDDLADTWLMAVHHLVTAGCISAKQVQNSL